MFINSRGRMIIYQLLVVVALVAGIFSYNLYIDRKIERMAENTFNEIIIQQASHFKYKFESEKYVLETIAYLITNSKDIRQIDTKLTGKLSWKSDFEYILVFDKNGEDIHGQYTDKRKLSNNAYFQRALKGETVVFEPVYSQDKQEKYLLIATPLIFEKEIIGVLIGVQPADKLHTLFFPSFGGEGYSYIVNNDGEVIASSINENALVKNNNVFDIFKNANFYKGERFDSFKENLKLDNSGMAYFDYNGEKRILKYAPININGWNMLSLVPEQTIAQNANEITLVTMALSIFCILVVSLMTYRIYSIQKQSISRISEIAFVDDLTKAPTLARFKLEAQRFINDNAGSNFLMVKFDIEKFKLINESLGADIGDKVLISLSKALRDNTPGGYDRYAYLHDDEFLVLHIYKDYQDILDVRDAFKRKFKEYMGSDFDYFARIISGHYYMSLENCTDVDEAIEKANIAHRKAKETGAELVVYDENFIKEAMRKKDIENRMNFALESGEFKVYLQPQYLLNSESIVGAEALVRWIPDNGQIVYPNDFIPIFERNGFIIQLDLYMFEQVCKIIKNWIEKGETPVHISVNFSRLHLRNTNFVNSLCQIADRHGVPHKFLMVEITESTIFDNEAALMCILQELHAQGFTLAMDDFGAGYSSLGLLKNIPVDVIKLDKSFLDKVSDTERSHVVLANVIRLAKDLRIHTIAEGVETAENVDILKSLGCDTVQGYYYARPMPHESFKLC